MLARGIERLQSCLPELGYESLLELRSVRDKLAERRFSSPVVNRASLW